MFKFIKERFEEAKALYGVDLGNATRNFSRSISKLVTRYESFDDDFFEEFEETLISLDILPNLAILLRLELEKKILNKKVKSDTFQDNFITVLNEFVFTSENSNHEKLGKFPAIWLVVGVNGVGKTTTIAKLTHLQKAAGTSILLAAGDTFRAGAIEQLKI